MGQAIGHQMHPSEDDTDSIRMTAEGRSVNVETWK